MADKRQHRQAPVPDVRKYSEFLQMVRDKVEGSSAYNCFLCNIINKYPFTWDPVNTERLATRIKKDIKAYSGMLPSGNSTTLKTFLILRGPQPYCQIGSRLWYLDRMIKYWKARSQ